MRRRWTIAALLALTACGGGGGSDGAPPSDDADPGAGGGVTSLGPARCVGGAAGAFGCEHVDLLARVGLAELGASAASDVWGWTDAASGTEYALVGLVDRTAFVDLSDPSAPVVVGFMPSASGSAVWRDVKVIGDVAFVVADVAGHGMQILDLARLRAVGAPPATIEPDLRYALFGHAHNVAVDAASALVLAAGTDTCGGGLHIVDVASPMEPVFAGCFDAERVHDAQCVAYDGPDAEHRGATLCFAANESTLSVVDVSDPGDARILDRSTPARHDFVHQGWLTEDHRFFLLGDELDERLRGLATRTHVYDVSDLDAIAYAGAFVHATRSVDHNLFVRGEHVFEANYTSGLRVLRIGDPAAADLAEVAHFDTLPAHDDAVFAGAWSAFPFFASGVVAVSDTETGLYVLRPDLEAVARCADGVDNDGDGVVDLDDPDCADATDPSEAR